jgi:RNA polymerase sigma-70 factor (ECF subfamily)
MPKASSGEAALVGRAIAGDADAFGKLYLRHADTIYRYIYLRVGNAKDTEDLTEQVFLNAWEALPDYEQRGKPFINWVYRIAHNVVVDHHRQQRPLPATPLLEEEQWECQQPTLLSQVILAEQAATLASAISELSEDQQQVLILRFVEGLPHAEVADIIGKSEGASRVIQYRALAALKKLLMEPREGDTHSA